MARRRTVEHIWLDPLSSADGIQWRPFGRKWPLSVCLEAQAAAFCLLEQRRPMRRRRRRQKRRRRRQNDDDDNNDIAPAVALERGRRVVLEAEAAASWSWRSVASIGCQSTQDSPTAFKAAELASFTFGFAWASIKRCLRRRDTTSDSRLPPNPIEISTAASR